MKLVINNFEKLSNEDQEDLQNLVAGVTPDFEIVEENKKNGRDKK